MYNFLITSKKHQGLEIRKSNNIDVSADKTCAYLASRSLAGTNVSGLRPRFDSVCLSKNSRSPENTDAKTSISLQPGDNQTPVTWDLKKLDAALGSVSNFSPSSKMGADEVIAYMASQIVVYQEHLGRGGDTAQLKELKAIIDKHVENFSNHLAETVGGFFEENGMDGEKAKIYGSAKSCIENLILSYGNFINSGSDFNFLDAQGADELSSTLRTAFSESGMGEYGTTGNYNRKQLAVAAHMVKTAHSIMNSQTADIKSEEEMGIRLGTMAVKALSYLDHLDPMEKINPKVRKAFLHAIGTKMNELLDGSDRLLADKRALGTGSGGYPPLDRGVISSYVQMMVGYYGTTKSIYETTNICLMRGYRSYQSRQDPDGPVERYKSSSYWNGVWDSIQSRYRQKTDLEKIFERMNVILPTGASIRSLFGADL